MSQEQTQGEGRDLSPRRGKRLRSNQLEENTTNSFGEEHVSYVSSFQPEQEDIHEQFIQPIEERGEGKRGTYIRWKVDEMFHATPRQSLRLKESDGTVERERLK